MIRLPIPFPSLFPSPMANSPSSISPWYLAGGGIPASACVGAYNAKGALSLADSYINRITPGTYNLAPGVAPGWNVTDGWVCDGTKYLLTGIIPSSTWSMFVRFSNQSGGTRCVIGEADAGFTSQFQIYPRAGANHNYTWGGASVSSAGTLIAGVAGLCQKQGYLNGSPDTAVVSNWPGVAVQIYIGATNNNGVVTAACTGNIQAVAIYNITLNAAQALALTNQISSL
jgi:hypothetical protein